MESIKSIIKSTYRGSLATAKTVKEEIARRWGEEEAKLFDPFTSCMTFRKWREYGFSVRKGEKAIRSFTIIEKKDELGNTIGTYPKSVALFHRLQVDPIIN